MPLRISREGGTTFRRSRMVKMYSPAIGRIKIAGAGRNGTGGADGRAPLFTALLLPRRPGGRLSLSCGLLHVATDQFGHLEHRDLLLAAENGHQRAIGVDHPPVLLVLQAVLLYVRPELLGEFSPRQAF